MGNKSWKRDAIREMAQEQREGTRCARCGRPAPAQDSDEFLEWEATGDGAQVTCPDCLTPEEEQAIGDDAMATVEKVRENRLRRMAERQGLKLVKSRRRDPRALGYGTYQLVNPYNNTLVAYSLPDGYGLDLDEIERELTQ